MDSGPERGLENRPNASRDASGKTGVMVRVAAWGAVLGVALGASLMPGCPIGAPRTTALTAFHAATTAAYLAVFAHCALRMICSRWPSWLLYTAGFGLLSLASAVGTAAGVGLIRDSLLLEPIALLSSAATPAAAVLLLAGAHASRERARGHRAAAWKSFLRAVIIIAGILLAWRFGAGSRVIDAVGAMSIRPRLLVDIVSAAVLAALLYRTHQLESLSHDEIVVPISYWSVAVLMGTLFSMASAQPSQAPWWQVRALELAGTVALVVGLSLVNERAHRKAAEQMGDLEAMQRISWSLVGASDLAELSDALARAVSEGFCAGATAVYVPDGDAGLVITATNGIDDPTVAVGKTCSLKPDRRPGFHNGHTARAFAGGEVQAVPVIHSDVEFLPWQMVACEEGLVVSVPLPHQDRIIGVVNLFLAGVRSMDDARIKLLEAVAAAVSPAIENAIAKSEPDSAIRLAA